jgi:hypothetical protein
MAAASCSKVPRLHGVLSSKQRGRCLPDMNKRYTDFGVVPGNLGRGGIVLLSDLGGKRLPAAELLDIGEEERVAVLLHFLFHDSAFFCAS